jgi:hypothetical protein
MTSDATMVATITIRVVPEDGARRRLNEIDREALENTCRRATEPERKEQQMRRITKITLFSESLVLFAGLTGAISAPASLAEFEGPLQDETRAVQPDAHKVLTLEVAADCRTLVNGPNRADVSFGSGKIFPAGTLPSGMASNDPTQPVNGIAPIGDWTTRGQNAFPFPPEIAQEYSSTPVFFATQYYILNEGRALTVEAYAFASLEAFGAVTGGVGGFSGASGDIHGVVIGSNATGCPNFRARFNIRRGSLRSRGSD